MRISVMLNSKAGKVRSAAGRGGSATVPSSAAWDRAHAREPKPWSARRSTCLQRWPLSMVKNRPG